MTRKGHQPVEPTPRAPKPCEAAPKRATLQKLAELLLDEAGQPLTVAEVGRLPSKRLEVIAHHLKQDARRRLPRPVAR
jgi:hypothetical protein